MRTLNPDDSGPAHTQIAAAIRDAIEDGEFQPGQPIPSRAQLREHFGVANATVSRAIGTLQAEGLLVGRHGHGVFVRTVRAVPVEIPYDRVGALAVEQADDGTCQQVEVYSCGLCMALVPADRLARHTDYHQEDRRG